ncbi:protein NUCLEAR FUSION DEFECTIVE 6, chloroplastic/mitochondrial isoform X1 [Morus notabilis]|uniref:protein NUCLEAR FUSION DEFECTIVE 6, chloroplastic/mitochondrial isoform X1 n=1 Tax=Morus notabilis TaxID=981085 RepID=UPI000CED1D4C|nr:protein NUCLEAR FUSION DEFECTIVE 6, chloroplastic/mitochondrial isoform X1 [Morus notabilis]XP_024031064.1 protein NUCLEAR FUSION DEFECTIVE 6, chloroplastic/mitochondrial isoform X1 [Morus notabilis]
MSTFAAARSVLRSAAGRTSLGSRISAAARSKPPSSPFRIPRENLNRLSRPTFRRSAVEMSRCVESMLPYHTATACALLNSMLSVSCRTQGWNLEDCNDDV